mmetsp:Transcript_16408/g.35467  ORF Transcript_16408/g.35467 Transcript_16408/m.35467 type:complete len:803 (-) Transcript_16408:228-2636(-)|eukprot:CAMPEP_0172308978 /NCGR_PEP_ID=MMETSP1058-20130122/9408_1 /TAXON_ID=83371 /ORGANISM="Detonula confervacea, Strain CCMP 353" /LENGTH=802 /DNA_ID=CAMNT_0013021519 /DNA_START=350 /DNA_END=2758 /DNA_ORIENTATION=+
MMSAPDRVDVDIPNTQEAKMVSVKSTENLRHLVPSDQQEHHSQYQSTGITETPSSPHSHNSSKSMPVSITQMPMMSATSQSLHQQLQQPLKQQSAQQRQQSFPEYTAWTIGSTETLKTSQANNSNSHLPPTDLTSPYKSAMLARFSQPSPDLTDNSSLQSLATISSSVTPPPPPVVQSTLGGLSQNMSIDPSMPMGQGGHQQQLQQQQQQQLQQQRSLSMPPVTQQNFQPLSRANSLTSNNQNQHAQYNKPLQQLYQTRLLSSPIPAVESLLSSSCEALNFDIAEMWLRTGLKTHQLTNSHVRPTALDESVRKQLVDVYYGERSAERTHRLSPALCKRAKEAGDVVWVTAHTLHGAEALKCSISDVRTAVAVPVCHGGSGVNVTIIYFSIRRAIMKPQAVEFLVHMSLAVAAAAVNSLAEEVMVDEVLPKLRFDASVGEHDARYSAAATKLSKSAHVGDQNHIPQTHQSVSVSRDGPHRIYSVTGAQLNLQWDSLRNVEYLTDGGNNWIHTAVLHGKSVVVKTLKPECQDVALAINEIEGELEIHSRLDHSNIVKLIGAGYTPRGVRFVVLERLDGGTLAQLLGYDNRIRDRRRRFWSKKKISYMDVLKCARSLADALAYCHGRAIPNVMVLHRDLKPDNVGFTLDGTVKLIDFGLARIVENASVSNEIYEMSGETGSLRYMAPEVADCQRYNQKADVYSFGIILWELVAFKKPYDGMNREEFYSRVVHGGERPVINKKWPEDLTELMKSTWDAEVVNRPNFSDIVEILDSMLAGEKDGDTKKKRPKNKFVSALIDRHSTWF